MADDEEVTQPGGLEPPSRPRDDGPERFAEVVLSGFDQRLSERLRPLEAAHARTEQAVKRLHNYVTERAVRFDRRVSILEATRLAPLVAACALAFAAFGIVTVVAVSAQANGSCSEGHR